MPELPEVETIRLQLDKLLPGKKIQEIKIINTGSFSGNKSLLIGKTILSVDRFAKILVFNFSSNLFMGVHLKMTGQLLINSSEDKHTRVILRFNDGDSLNFRDIRKFGWMRIVKNLADLWKNLGPDALNDLNFTTFCKILSRSKKPVKTLLMDQNKIAGVGNIYANESLFFAKINSKTPSHKISGNEAKKLLESLKYVLRNGLRLGGASRTNFLDVYGRKGMVQEHFSVYDREGYFCINKCGGKIKRFILGGRSTFYCPACQR